MCGICGWLGPPAVAPDNAEFDRMRDILRHRGPYGPGSWRRASPGLEARLGHRRLRILDLSEAAHQPIVGDDGEGALTYNGEIYNFRELRDELRGAGASFTSTGDTEVILRAYECWGEAGLERLDGIFAIALWDGRARRLLLMRDRTGKKPLFYWTEGRLLAFGSEIMAVLAAPDVPRRMDEARLAEYLTFGYVPNPATLYAGVSQVPPACIVTVDEHGLRPARPYCSALDHARWDRNGGLEDDVRELLDAAVRRRLVSDVPLGALLSGGIDSSVVVALMKRHLQEPVHTFSIGFPEDESFDERSHARTVAEHLGIRHTEFAVRLDAVRLMDRLLWHHDQPYMDSSAIPTYLVCELAREHVTVALNSDEAFGGYDRFRAAALAPRLPAPVARAARAAIARLPADQSYHSPRNRALPLLEQAHRPVEQRYHSWSAVTGEELVDAPVAPEVLAAAAEPLSASVDRRYAEASHLPALDRILHANFTTYLPDDLAVKMDRMSMAQSLETRSPFLDTALIERIAAVPARRKVGVRRLKPVLRRAFMDLIPREIFDRRKHGFGVPMGTWFRGELGTMFEDEVLAGDARSAGVLQQPAVARMYGEHREGTTDHGHRPWTILTLERWLRSLEAPPASAAPAPLVDAEHLTA